MEMYVKASDGKDIRISCEPFPGSSTCYGSPIPMMDRDESRANTTITAMGFELAYDKFGYCYKRLKLHV